MQIVKIPPKRASYLKENKTNLEERLNIKLVIKEEIVEIAGGSLEEYLAKQVITAIAKGFNMETALKLLNQNFALKVIDLKEFIPEHAVKRQLGRVIGEKGKCKKTLEEEGNVVISIQGHEVSVLGNFEDIEIAVNAIQKLISGAPHTSVFRYISTAQAKKSGAI